MRMLNLLKITNKLRRSQLLLFGSFFIFVGFVFISWNYLMKMRNEVYSDMNISMMDTNIPTSLVSPSDTVIDVPIVENVDQKESDNTNYVVDYSKYLGVLEIPKISLKRGFYSFDSKYNNIQYNVTILSGSSLPDVSGGNLILMAHSGDAYISYFAYLYKLEVGDSAFITYNGNKYEYRIVDIYEVLKNGIVSIRRNRNATTLTMITCTKNSDTLQTVYIAELV